METVRGANPGPHIEDGHRREKLDKRPAHSSHMELEAAPFTISGGGDCTAPLYG